MLLPAIDWAPAVCKGFCGEQPQMCLTQLVPGGKKCVKPSLWFLLALRGPQPRTESWSKGCCWRNSIGAFYFLWVPHCESTKAYSQKSPYCCSS